MGTFISSVFSILIQAFAVALLATITFVIAKTLYKPSFTKNKINLAMYIIAGLIVCLGASLALGYDDTPPCLEMEYDSRGSYCIEYDYSIAPKSYLEKVQASGKYFGITFPAFLFFIYKTKREQNDEDIRKTS